MTYWISPANFQFLKLLSIPSFSTNSLSYFPYSQFLVIVLLKQIMHPNQKIRFIQEIGFMLDLPQPAISTILHFYREFVKKQFAAHYCNEVVACTCIYLTSKIFQDERKIRDILNAIYSAIKLYQLAKQQQQEEGQQNNYIDLDPLICPKSKSYTQQQIFSVIQPTYDLTTYNDIKKQVIEAETLFLNSIKYDFSIVDDKIRNYKQLLSVCDQLRLPKEIIQIVINAYNDLETNQEIPQWIPGIIYFGVEVHQQQRIMLRQKSGLEIEGIQTGEKKVEKEKQEKNQINWEKLFLVSIKKLQIYCEKILSYYSRLTTQENEFEQPDSGQEGTQSKHPGNEKQSGFHSQRRKDSQGSVEKSVQKNQKKSRN